MSLSRQGPRYYDTSPLHNSGITAKYSPIRQPASNPAERIVKELGKYFKIYCHTTHKQWPDLIPHIQGWLNESISSVTGYCPTELLGGDVRNELVKKLPENTNKENLPNKILKAYARMKSRAEAKRAKRKESVRNWKPQIGDQVLVKGQPVSDATQGIIAKFQRPYVGPFKIKLMVNPYLYEIQDAEGSVKGLYHVSHLKPYRDQCSELQ
jgi:hypothetical protein